MALPQSMDPELRRRIEAAADRSDTSVDEWLERAARMALDLDAHGETPDEGGIVYPSSGAKLTPLDDPPRLRDGSNMFDAVIEDRR